MYSTGRKNVYLNMFAILGWIVNAWIYATIICLVYYYALEPSYQSYGLFEFGTSVFTAMAMGLQAKVAFLHHQWAWPQITVMFVSIVAMFIFFEILSASNNYSTSGYYFVTDFLYQDALFWWFAVFTTPLMLLLLDMFCHLIYLFFFPTEEMKYREIDLHVSLIPFIVLV